MVRLFDWLLKSSKYFLFLAILAVGVAGYRYDACTASHWNDVEWWWQDLPQLADLVYRSAQLFFVGFDRNCAEGFDPGPIDILLQVARFSALLFAVAAVASFLAPRLVQRILILLQVLWPTRRVVVLGYGAVGQAVAHELGIRPRSKGKGRDRHWLQWIIKPLPTEWVKRPNHVASIFRWWRKGKFVTAVHKGVTPDLTERAKRDNIVLVEGDPSDLAVHRHIRIGRSSGIYAAVGSDMQTLDAAVAACASLGHRKRRVYALLSDPDLAAGMGETAPRGFLGASDIRGFSLASEAARLLIAEARFDRVALELDQKRVHLIIIGCGAQGEAVAIETLLTSWRTGLGAPTVTIFDRSEGHARERFHRRAPALFAEPPEIPLPEAARAEVYFHPLDADTTDFGSNELIKQALSAHGPATAWVFAAGDDSLNLRSAAALHLAMLNRRRQPAPIYVRIWSGHQGDTPILSSHPVGLAKAFGSLEATVAATPACDDDPDEIASELHQAYIDAGQTMDKEGQRISLSSAPWEGLPETLKNANRRLHRHALMKIEDLGGQWRMDARRVPIVDPNVRDDYVLIEKAIDYGKVVSGQLLVEWWLEKEFTPSSDAEVRRRHDERAQKLKDVAIAEHNRWTVDRALDGWRIAAACDDSLRDDDRRVHNNMHAWEELEPPTKRQDAVMLRALVQGDVGRSGSTAWKKQAHTIVLATKTAADAPEGNVPKFEPRCRLVLRDQIGPGLTELRVIIGGEPRHQDIEATLESASAVFSELLADPGVTQRLCRVRFDFLTPPRDGALAIANALGALAASWTEPTLWLRVTKPWRALKQVAYATRPDNSSGPFGERKHPGIEVSALWKWDDNRVPMFGFVGHRDLGRLDGPEGLADYLERFFARRISEGRISGLVSGYAPGADRIAVDAWIAVGVDKVTLFFPDEDSDGTDPATKQPKKVYLTNGKEKAGPAERVREEELRDLANLATSKVRPGLDRHRSQALDILDRADVLVAVYDGTGKTGAGSVGETIKKAKASGKKVIIIDRDGKGAWRDHSAESTNAMD